MTEFSGKIALVTGGGSGIGRGLALALAAEGASVIVADIKEDTASAVAREIRESGGIAFPVFGDVSDREAVEKMKEAASAALGPVSLLFANAGATAFDPISTMPATEIDWILQVNLHGVMNCLHVFLPDMIAARTGYVVATASMAGLIPAWIPTHVPYVAAKLGIIGLMLNLRHELAADGIGCTVLCPGAVSSNITASPSYRPARFGGPADIEVPDQGEVIKAAGLDFRLPEDVAQMVLSAMRKNRAMVLTDSTRRALFQQSYVDMVMTAFDDAAEFDAARD